MRIVLTADHAGVDLKDELADWLAEQGHEVTRPRHQRPRKRRLPAITGRCSPRRLPTAGPSAGSPSAGPGSASPSPPTATPLPLRAGRRAAVRDARAAAQRRQRDRARRAPDRRRNGQGLRHRLPLHRFPRRPPPAPRRPTLPPPAGTALMATAADLERDQTYRVPHGFFTSGLSETDPAVEDAIQRRAPPRADPDRADRVGEYRQPRGARGAGLGAHQQICRGLSRPPLLPGLRARPTRSRRWRSSAPRNCSAAASPTSSRIRARRPMAR